MANKAIHAGRALYSILRYWRSVGLNKLELPELHSEDEVAIQQDSKLQKLAELAQQCSVCKNCELHLGRTRSIFGQGPLRAALMFVGSSPTSLEESTALAFQGEEGELLDRMLNKMGFLREQVYLTYATPCRAPNDRAPTWEELLTCRPWLIQQIELVAPRCIVTLGTTASQILLERQSSISHLRGQWQKFQKIPVMPTYHPGYLLKKSSARKDVWTDMLAVLEVLNLKN